MSEFGVRKGLLIEDHRQLGAGRGPRKSVLILLTLVDVSPVVRFLQIFDKQYVLPVSPRRGTFWRGAVFVNLKLNAEFL